MMLPDSYFEDKPLRLAEGPQLLLDDFLVEDRIHLERVLYHPMKHPRNPILMGDLPWEGAAYRPQVVWDQEVGRYRAWYQCVNMNNYFCGGPTYYVGYAESDDGIAWEKPRRDDCPFEDWKATNIVYTGDRDSGNRRSFSLGQAFIDPDDAPERRYKMLGLDARQHPRHPDIVNTEINLVCSPDGFQWKLTGDRSILDHHSDTANHLVYDPDRQRWLLYCRPVVYSSGRDGESGRHHRRRTSVMISRDFESWSYPRVVRVPDELDWTDVDHCRVFRYGSHFLMLYAAMDGGETGRMVMRLASSADGLNWTPFHTREDFLPLGGSGAWDAGILGPTCPPVARGSDLLLYYLAANMGQMESFPERHPRYMGAGVATMKEDRFVAQRAGARTGYLLTREFVLEGDTLLINAACDLRPYRESSIRVEVLQHPQLGYHADAWLESESYSYACPGFELENCVPVRADATRLKVRWRDHDLGELQGQSVYLRFELRHADLFAWRVS